MLRPSARSTVNVSVVTRTATAYIGQWSIGEVVTPAPLPVDRVYPHHHDDTR
jgi:hypothetical protein